jgi:AcrR family transcriptional regulator
MTRTRLSPEALVEIALGVIDERGLAGLTLTAVADRADVAVPSLYKHVRNLAELQQLVTVRVVQELTARLTQVALGRAGHEALRAMLLEFRGYATDYPHRYAFTVQAAPPDTRVAAAAEGLLELFLSVLRSGYGLEGPDAIHAARALRSACHGFVTLQATGGFGLPESLDVSYQLLVQMIIDGLPLANRVDDRRTRSPNAVG